MACQCCGMPLSYADDIAAHLLRRRLFAMSVLDASHIAWICMSVLQAHPLLASVHIPDIKMCDCHSVTCLRLHYDCMWSRC